MLPFTPIASLSVYDTFRQGRAEEQRGTQHFRNRPSQNSNDMHLECFVYRAHGHTYASTHCQFIATSEPSSYRVALANRLRSWAQQMKYPAASSNPLFLTRIPDQRSSSRKNPRPGSSENIGYPSLQRWRMLSFAKLGFSRACIYP